MSKKKTAITVIIVLILCGAYYFLSNQLRIEEVVPQELRVIHTYHEVPGASWDTLSDEDITDAAVIGEIMDELENNSTTTSPTKSGSNMLLRTTCSVPSIISASAKSPSTAKS